MARQFYYTHKSSPLAPTKVITRSVNNPSEAAIPQQEVYDVPADKPRRLMIPAIGLDAFIQQAGDDQNRRIAVPDNINLAGWYTSSALPGSSGLSVIDGHVTGQYTQGVFYNLNKLRSGDVISVEYGRHSATYNFRVKSLRAVPVDQATEILFARDSTIVSQLNLITCSAYNSSSGHYDDRTIVVAERI